MKHRAEAGDRLESPLELDGVPLLHAPHPDGQYAAGLVFRVGRADETLATSGITHLIEHLALHEHGMSDLHYNGTTADLFTHFFVRGTAEQVRDYLHGVCAGLQDLPLHRLEIEKRLLANEAEGRSSTPSLIYRHGAEGHGLPAYAELGLHGIGPDDVRAWAARHFTRGNAALWICGSEVPPGLRLDLPDGARIPAPAVTAHLPQLPAWFGSDGNVLVASGLLPRTATSQVFAQVLDRVLFRDLRQRDGISYRAGTDYAPLDRDLATVWAIADCAPDQRAALVGSYADAVARLRLRGPTAAEVESAVTTLVSGLGDPTAESQRLPGRAFNLLLGRDDEEIGSLIAQTRAVSRDEVRAAAQLFHETSVVQVPAIGLDWAGHARAPELSTGEPVRGTRHAPSAPGGVELTIGSEGVTRHYDQGHATVRYAETAAMLRHPDGGRELVGLDGVRVSVEPTLTSLSGASLAAMDAAVGVQRTVPMPPRAPEDQPRLVGPEPEPGYMRWVRFGAGSVVAVITLAFALVLITTSEGRTLEDVAFFMMITSLLLVFGFWIVRPALPRRGRSPRGRRSR